MTPEQAIKVLRKQNEPTIHNALCPARRGGKCDCWVQRREEANAAIDVLEKAINGKEAADVTMNPGRSAT